MLHRQLSFVEHHVVVIACARLSNKRENQTLHNIISNATYAKAFEQLVNRGGWGGPEKEGSVKAHYTR